MNLDPAAAASDLTAAYAALARGERRTARRLAEQAIAADPTREDGWLILAAVASPAAAVNYLHQALAIDPANRRAQAGLAWAEARLAETSTAPPAPSTQPTAAARPTAASSTQPVAATRPTAAAGTPPPSATQSCPPGRTQPIAATRPTTAAGTPPPSATQPRPRTAAPLVAPLTAAARVRPTANLKPLLLLLLLVLAGLIGTSAFLFIPQLSGARPAHDADLTIARVALAKETHTPTPLPTATATATPTSLPTATSTPIPLPTETATPPPPTDPPPPEVVPVEAAPAPVDLPNGVGSYERWIEVDLSQQIARAYIGPELQREFLVSTGTWEHPTVTGRFHIYVKYVSADMSGPGYFLPAVPYVMYFYQGYGLHGTYWHNNFGTPMSHGCVNFSTQDARWLFGFADVGTLVQVHR